MPTGRQQGPQGARQASPRALAIAGGVILIVILAVVLAVVLSRSSSNTTTTTNNTLVGGTGDGPKITLPTGTPAIGSHSNPNALHGAADVAKLFQGIPQHGFVLGRPDAPVTLVEYIDLQCPICQSFETTALPTLISRYIRPGKLKIEMKTWNILDGNDGTVDSLRGQKATIAAADQNKAFNFAELLYDNQGTEGTNWMNDAVISNLAASVDGLNTRQFARDANSAATASLIRSIDNYANSQPDFVGTPTLLLAKGNGAPRYYGTGSPAMDLANLEPAIDNLLK